MSETLYRKYRPQKFAEIIGQEHIVTTLTNALVSNRLGHAYLFTGSRGTGKTTVARLFATAINCEKRDGFAVPKKEICTRFQRGDAIDLIEIDAASHTGVDNIRDLRDTIALMPSEVAYKVYIIDEVHMLSIGAFNALLKTLEEPPEHVVFILATTDIHKVPETIISRCQRFDFTRLSVPHIIKKLTIIAKAEKIKVASDALEMIAISARGGMRDAESLLAQVFALGTKKITFEHVSTILGTTTNSEVTDLLEAFVAYDIDCAFRIINDVADGGYDLNAFATSLIIRLRALLFYTLTSNAKLLETVLLTKTDHDVLISVATKTDHIAVLEMITAIQKAKPLIGSSIVPQLPLEVAAVTICKPTAQLPNGTYVQSMSEKSPKAEKKNSSESVTPTKKSSLVLKADDDAGSLKRIQERWHTHIRTLEDDNLSLSILLGNALPYRIKDDRLILVVKYTLHKERLTDPQTRLTIERWLATIAEMPLRIDVDVVSEDAYHSASPSELLSRATTLMGGHMA